MNLETLTGADGLLTRSMEIRATDTEQREFTAIGVPYGEEYEIIPGVLRERFEPGSVTGEDVKVFWRHGEVIGRILSERDTEAGREITGKISDTALGRDAWTLLRDGAINKISIGFVPIEYRVETHEDGSETIVHTRCEAREYSLVPNPAYQTANVLSHRHNTPKGSTVETETLTRADLQPLTDAQEEMRREIGKLAAGTAGPAPAIEVPQYRNIGEFVRAVANRDEAALKFHETITNREAPANVLADAIVKESWVGDYVKLVEERRRVFNTFGKGVLPASGMKVEFGKLKTDTTRVAEQENEGDDLAGPGKVALEIDSATVHTVGGWSSLSFQAIQRATVPTVNTLWRAMVLKYAAGTEARVRKTYMDLIAERRALGGDDVITLAGDAGVSDWLDAIVDAALLYEERGFLLEGMHASVDQFKSLSRLEDTAGNRLMNVYGSGVNQVGELNLKAVGGSLANVRVDLIGNRSTRGQLAFYDSSAIETLESPGAPIQLQDENIIDLTKQLSLYGYVAVTTPFPEAIVPVSIGTAGA